MMKLQQLYAEQGRLKERKATGFAGMVQRHQKNSKLQKEIDYYELDDSISREEIQAELKKIVLYRIWLMV